MVGKWVTILDERGKVYSGYQQSGKKKKCYRNSVQIRSKGGSIHCGKIITDKINSNLKGIKKS